MLAELIQQLTSAVERLVLALGYPGIGLTMTLENVFPPIPSELIMPMGGFLVARGELTFLGVWVFSTLGSMIGALILYGVGRWVGDPALRSLLRRYGRWLTLDERDYDRALRYFARYGAALVFFGRLIPFVRSIVSIPAGANRMPLVRFMLLTAAGPGLWNGLLA